MDCFQKKYRYAKFEVMQGSVTIKSKLSYDDLCKWLSENRLSLFGTYIFRTYVAESWSAEFFIRHETTI
jgi:hypothetical protein